MKYFLRIFILLFPVTLFAQNYGHKSGFNLVWFDEFRDSSKTFSLWQSGYPWGQWAGGLAYFNKEGNHQFEGESMSILVKKEYVNGEVAFWDEQGNYEPYYKDFDYSAAMLYSKRNFLYGYFECRFKVPKVKGLNNAFWLYGEADAEIDVFEILGSKPNRAQMTLHWRGDDPLINSSQSFTYLDIPNPSFADTHHTMATLWDSTQVKFFHNNKLVEESNFVNLIRSRHIPKTPLNLIVSTSIGGLDGNPDSTSVFPATYNIDYVRVYQNNKIIPAPVIIGQAPLKFFNYEPIRIDENWLSVQNFYQTYPFGFKVLVLPGNNYTVNGQEVTITKGVKTPVFVNVQVNDGINSSMTYSLKLEAAQNVGLSEINLEQFVILYPNPVDQQLFINNTFNENVFIEIIGIDGRLVLQDKIEQGIQILDVSKVEAGMYIANIKPAKKTSTGYRVNLMIR